MHFNVTSLLVGLTSLLALSPSPRNSKSLNNTTKTPAFQRRNLATIQKVYSLNLYPTNLAFLDNQTVPPGLFDEHASGRITPLGNFTDFAESTEYFFGLSLTPEDPDNLAFTKVEVVEYQSSCAEVASSVAWLYLGVYNPGAANHGQVVSVLKQIAFWYFTPTGSILRYDAHIPSLRGFISASTSLFGPSNSHPSPNATISQLCGSIQDICGSSSNVVSPPDFRPQTPHRKREQQEQQQQQQQPQHRTPDPYAQFDSKPDCETSLSKKPLGTFDNPWSDTLICRVIHLRLAAIDPERHCKHIGESGGGKCVEVGYGFPGPLFGEEERLWGVGRGEAFKCPGMPNSVEE